MVCDVPRLRTAGGYTAPGRNFLRPAMTRRSFTDLSESSQTPSPFHTVIRWSRAGHGFERICLPRRRGGGNFKISFDLMSPTTAARSVKPATAPSHVHSTKPRRRRGELERAPSVPFSRPEVRRAGWREAKLKQERGCLSPVMEQDYGAVRITKYLRAVHRLPEFLTFQIGNSPPPPSC